MKVIAFLPRYYRNIPNQPPKLEVMKVTPMTILMPISIMILLTLPVCLTILRFLSQYQ